MTHLAILRNYFTILFFALYLISCNQKDNSNSSNSITNDSLSEVTLSSDSLEKIAGFSTENKENSRIIPADEQFAQYLPLLKSKRVGLIVNQSAKITSTHLVDTLVSREINVMKIFAPEHGFRGNVDRGKQFDNSIDPATGLPIIALYGQNKKPTAQQLQDIDIMVFDIQDVGARFYTYISTMHLAMEACAETGTEFLVLDRPSPLGDYVDGPVREADFQSFVGMHPIPVVHGLTVGELAQMINGEGWLANGQKCQLTVIPVKNYTHSMAYSLPVKPSPNLPNDLSIRLYPSLCFFEATEISIGRGTDFPFQVAGYPDSVFGTFTFTPRDKPGEQINPVQEGQMCFGLDLRNEPLSSEFTLKYLIDFYEKAPFKDQFFSRPQWFNLLAGNSTLQNQIKNGMSEAEIKATWQTDLESYKNIRKKYLLYPDFE